ncbi:MAG TPA: dTDP-4-dehydrorhamnose reductase, partial [Terriglobales bacterium]|nr:dTDP-4-dehydrorhamnose reductase [Terriglobales bacterium]
MLGGGGQVGSALLPGLAELGEVSAPGHSQLDLGSAPALRKAVRALQPAIVVNAAAYTAVDRAEAEPEFALRVNADAPAILAEEARRCGAVLLHYSTDYVFDGAKTTPYDEEDATGPLNVYGRSKLLGEEGVAAVGGAWFILRTGWVYAARGNNFLLTILRRGAEQETLAVVEDQVGTPTPAAVVARATLDVLRACRGQNAYECAQGRSGIYHAGCAGQASWFQFALAILAEAGSAGLGATLKVAQVLPITSAEYAAAALRPRYSVL